MLDIVTHDCYIHVLLLEIMFNIIQHTIDTRQPKSQTQQSSIQLQSSQDIDVVINNGLLLYGLLKR